MIFSHIHLIHFRYGEPISAENDCWEKKLDLTITSFGSKAPRNAEEFVSGWQRFARVTCDAKPTFHSFFFFRQQSFILV